MAMIVPKRRKKGIVYYIVQNLRHETGKRYQHWIPCASIADAKLLLREVEDAEKRNELYEVPLEFRIHRQVAQKGKAYPSGKDRGGEAEGDF